MRRTVACVLGLLLAGVVGVQAQTIVPPLFRLYLTDGTEVTTYGEFARLDGHVVATVPVGPVTDGVPPLETVTIAADRIDWTQTEAYLQAVRLAQYTASTAERDYAAFTEDVAMTLDRVSTTQDPLARIGIVEEARARLIDWPRQHFGYRQEDATAMLAVLDDVLAGLRAAAGQQHFTLALTTGTAAPTPPPLRAAPTLRDVVAQALALSRQVDDPAQRVQLLRHAIGLLETDQDWDRRWVRRARRDARSLLEAEQKQTRAYAVLRDRVLARATRLLARADVRSLLALKSDAIRRDERLGRRRPGEMAALLGQLDVHLDEARQLRLALDRWEQRRPIVEAYARRTSELLATLTPVVRALDDIRTLSGPSLAALDRVDGVLAGVQVQAQQATTPEEGHAVQGLITATLQMAASAVRTRRIASMSGELPKAWEASAAAAGALMTLERAREDLSRLVDVPRPGDGRSVAR